MVNWQISEICQSSQSRQRRRARRVSNDTRVRSGARTVRAGLRREDPTFFRVPYRPDQNHTGGMAVWETGGGRYTACMTVPACSVRKLKFATQHLI